MDIRKMEKAVVAALEDIKGRDIVVLKVAHLSPLFERMIIASADSTRQVKSLADNVAQKLKAAGAHVLSVEGAQTGEWVLVDLGAIIVHVMQPGIRQYYNLEELWDQPEPKRPRARKKAAQSQPAAG
ncbi:MAG: ribosome silencing factor [Betaproteobacteria bacterium RIFCSPLOWO2_02_FULL_65_24]|nr:MAG: ribosome silencing factor [Betaproteobacteria bacterium RIFCSPLOWO2_02_FULL_65_24]